MPDYSATLKAMDDAIKALALAFSNLSKALATPPPADPTGAVTVTATPLSSSSVRVDWSTTRTDVVGYTVGRDGTDASGTGAWSTDLPSTTKSQTFNNLLPATRYTFSLTPKAGGATAGTASAVATTLGSTSTPAPSTGTADDGTQAAVRFNWGPVKDGDEFSNGTAPGSKWSLYNGAGHNGNGRRVPSAFTVKNGVLTCTGTKSGDTGGMAFSRNQKYGRYEVRMKTGSINPNAGGDKYHPVLILWPQDDRWPQGAEYDFFETDCDSGEAGCFMHYPSDRVEQLHYTKKLDIENWHNYAIEWTNTALTGYIDGVQWWKITESRMQAPGPMHLTIQLDNFSGGTMCPGTMDVAWVRYYDV